MNVKLLLVSSLEKIFPDEEPRAFDGRVEGLLNESVSFQAAWKTLDELPALYENGRLIPESARNEPRATMAVITGFARRSACGRDSAA